MKNEFCVSISLYLATVTGYCFLEEDFIPTLSFGCKLPDIERRIR